MKHINLLILTVLACFQGQAQVANGSFEEWETIETYEQPIGFATGNRSQHSLNVSGSVPSVPYATSKVDGLNGGNAVRLTTANQGIASTSGTIGTEDIFLSGFQKLPYTGTPTGIDVTIRYSIAEMDSADFLFKFYKGGTVINETRWKVGGEQAGFAVTNIPVPTFTESPDEVGILIRNSDRINLDSWLELDLIEFIGTIEQLPNNSFDDWAFKAYSDPTDWGSTNFVTEPIIDLSGISQSSDAFAGSSSLRIEALPKNQLIRVSTESDFIAYAANVDFETVRDNVTSGSPLMGTNQLTFTYKYSDVDGGQAQAVYLLMDQNGEELGSGEMVLDIASDWTTVDMPFGVVSGATQVAFGFEAGYLSDGTYNPDGGAVLLVDDVNLSLISATNNLAPLDNVIAFYNSEVSQVTVRFEEMIEAGHVTIYQANGTKILNQKFNDELEVSAKVNNLPAGIYLIDVITSDKRGTVRLYID